MITLKEFINEEISSLCIEGVEISHDRYIRSHGKKFRDSGHSGSFLFTHKRMGDTNYDDEKEVHEFHGKWSDAKKSASDWAKKHGHSTVYIMEQVELDNIDEKEDMKNPCWKGYEALGVKKKNGKTVPNCVPVVEEKSELLEGWWAAPETKADHEKLKDILSKPLHAKDVNSKLGKLFHGDEILDYVHGKPAEHDCAPAIKKMISHYPKLHKNVFGEEVEVESTELQETAYEKDMDDKKPVYAQGVKGMKSKPFTKKFKSMSHYEKWTDSDEYGNHEVHRVFQERFEPEDFYLEEALTKSDPIGKWISDFVHSDNPKFAGKSKQERIKMAQGAYYAAQNEEVELEEASFAPTMSKAIAAHERGDKKLAKYHLDNAKTARYAMKSTEISKHKDLLDKYKELRGLYESSDLEEAVKLNSMVGKKVKVDTANGTKEGVVKQVTSSHIFVQHPNINGTIGYHHEYVKLNEGKNPHEIISSKLKDINKEEPSEEEKMKAYKQHLDLLKKQKEEYLSKNKKSIYRKEEVEELDKISKADLTKEETELEEGILDSVKKGWVNGLQNGVRKSIKPEHHSEYDIDKITSVSASKETLKKAKEQGHLAESVQQLDEIDNNPRR